MSQLASSPVFFSDDPALADSSGVHTPEYSSIHSDGSTDSSDTHLDPLCTSSHNWKTIACSACGHLIRIVIPCGDRLCPECREIHAQRTYMKYLALMPKLKAPKLITLTLKNTIDLTPDHVLRLRDAWRKLIRRKFWKEKIHGGIYSIECTNIGNGWHLHIHALVDAEYLPYCHLSECWHRLTGDSYIVDVRQCKTTMYGLRYICKYIAKSPEVNGNQTLYNDVMHNVRLIHTFGTFYSWRHKKEPQPCPKCGAVAWIDFDRLMEDPCYLVYFERFKASDSSPPLREALQEYLKDRELWQ